MYEMVSLSILTIILASFGVSIAVIILFSMYTPYLLGRLKDGFDCTGCGNCCRFRKTHLTKADIDRLEKSGKTGFHDKADRESILKRVNGRCIFLVDDKCRVYEHRPQVCREFPFYEMYGCWWACKCSMCPALEKLEEKLDDEC